MTKDLPEQETIVAVATPMGRGGIGIVRVSGPDAASVVQPMLRLRHPLAAGRARFAEVVDAATGEALDQAVVTYFQAPHSYTGEDVVEIAAHGAPVLLDYLLRQCCAHGARLAMPGEFTQRAFLGGRMDLTQAEAVGDLIHAGTLEQARVAARQLAGGLSRKIAPAKERLVSLIATLEAGIDFAEDDISILPNDQIRLQIEAVEEPLRDLERSFAYGRVVRDGLRLALVGRPNAGKSSLFNQLLQRERAIVTAAPGTTRDPIAERLSIGGIPVELVDTAGLRNASTKAPNKVEALNEAELLGITKSREEMAEAALVLLVVDATLPLDQEDVEILRQVAGRGLLMVLNKIDLAAPPAVVDAADDVVVTNADARRVLPAEASLATLHLECLPQVVRTSALRGDGIADLRQEILVMIQGSGSLGDSAMVTTLRQHQALTGTLAALAAGHRAVASSVPHEMVLLDLYEALQALDSLTGVTTADDILHLIFSRFCIGK